MKISKLFIVLIIPYYNSIAPQQLTVPDTVPKEVVRHCSEYDKSCDDCVRSVNRVGLPCSFCSQPIDGPNCRAVISPNMRDYCLALKGAFYTSSGECPVVESRSIFTPTSQPEQAESPPSPPPTILNFLQGSRSIADDTVSDIQRPNIRRAFSSMTFGSTEKEVSEEVSREGKTFTVGQAVNVGDHDGKILRVSGEFMEVLIGDGVYLFSSEDVSTSGEIKRFDTV